jgi:hypothetical protein
VLDVREAMRDDAPDLNDDIRTEAFGFAIRPGDSKPTNIAKHFLFDERRRGEGLCRGGRGRRARVHTPPCIRDTSNRTTPPPSGMPTADHDLD